MKITFTNLKNSAYRASGKLFMLLATVLMGSSAFAQTYCNAYHYFGCGYNSTAYRYSAIEEVTFTQNGNVLYSKTPDGCQDIASTTRNSSYYNTINTSPGFKLAYGSEFSIWISGQNYNFYTSFPVGVWIDLNRDGDFGDAGEFLGNKIVPAVVNRTLSGTPPAAKEFKFQIPCGASGSGTSRIRLRSTAPYNTNGWTAGQSCTNGTGSSYYGETEDFIVTLSNATTVQAGFFMVDTAYVKTKVSMVNTNQEGYTYHGWDIGDDGSIEFTTTDASTKFNSTGKYCVRLYSENCVGRDSILKCVEIVAPTAPPVADFVSSSNAVELYNTFQLTDLSTNGAIYWEWFMYQQADSAGTHIDIAQGGTEADQNPVVFSAKGIPGFPDVGKWCVGLTSSNDIGASATVIKCDYIEILKGCDVEMGPGTLTSISGNVITCTAGSMISKMDGSGNYSPNESGLDALIAPCGATSISFTFDKWKVKAGVNLKIYDGQDATGIPLHPNNGFDDKTAPSGPIVAKSGAMYFLWNSGGATDEGFLGYWTSTIGTQAPPVAKFDGPDTVYNAVFNQFINTSENAVGEVFYTWEVDGVVESNAKNLDFISFSNKTYNMCLTVETCAGKNKSCRNIVVAPITSKTNLDFDADNRRPKAGDDVVFTSKADKANSFKWTFFPSTSVTFTGGTDEFSANPQVAFSAPGKYTVSLKGWNNLSPTDSATSYAQVIKDQFIIVIDYCKPVIGVTTSADVSISKVILEDNATPRATLIDNESTEEIGYTDFTADVRAAELTFGGTYNLTIERQTNANKVNRKVWIDWNIDGDFDDAGEMVLSEGTTSNKTVMGSFTVPDLANSFEGTTRMRVGISYNNDPNVPCGASGGVAGANRIGEFEDYALILANDNTTPLVELVGNDTVYVEVGSTYTDAGATAHDPTEGDISTRLTSTSDVDDQAAGIYYVTYCVSDASGNAAPCVTRVVYVVVDQSAPELTLTGADTVYVDVITGTYNEPGFKAIDKTDGDLTTAVQVTGTVNTFKIGTYTLTYTVQDAQANIATAMRTIIVRDQVFPTITNDEIKSINGRNVVEVQLQSVFVDRTVPADNYSNGTFGPRFTYVISPSTAQGDADVDTRVKGTTVVTYKVTDESMNETVLVIDYVVEDYIAPVISLNTLDTVYHNVNDPYTPVSASVTDNLYDNTQVSLTRTSNVNPFTLGLYTDTYTATDASGNVTVKNRWVRVLDSEKPVISSKVGPIVKLGLFSNVKLSDYLKLTDNYDAPAELIKNLEVTFNDVNFYEEGFYAAEFITTDNSGNVSGTYRLYVDVRSSYEVINSVGSITGADLMKVYPNPSNGIFNVSFDLPSQEDVTVAVYDMMGNQVANIIEGQLQKGTYTVDMTGKAAGMYFVRMTTHNQVFNQKVMVK
jgi:PKD repeat protein